MRRVKTTVSLAQARQRLTAYRQTNGVGPHKANTLADVIWPDATFIRSQGAGAAATRVLKKLGCYWRGSGKDWGWILSFPSK